MNASTSSALPPTANDRALVLGGGGSIGNAWLIGVLAGLEDGGSDATDADLVIGTSAGATAAAQLVGSRPSELLAAILSAEAPRPGDGAGPNTGRPSTGPTTDYLDRTNRIIAAATDAADMRRRMGETALQLDAASGGTWHTRWRAIVGGRFPGASWPHRAMLITAVDAHTGQPVVFDRHSGVDLVDAVAASTSSATAYRIGDGRYIDGGYRRNENADLATGAARVLVLSPLGGRTRHPTEWGLQLAAQVDELRAAGSRVETILPDAASLAAFGPDLMDVSKRPAAARSGFDQGRAAAAHLADFWL